MYFLVASQGLYPPNSLRKPSKDLIPRGKLTINPHVLLGRATSTLRTSTSSMCLDTSGAGSISNQRRTLPKGKGGTAWPWLKITLKGMGTSTETLFNVIVNPGSRLAHGHVPAFFALKANRTPFSCNQHIFEETRSGLLPGSFFKSHGHFAGELCSKTAFLLSSFFLIPLFVAILALNHLLLGQVSPFNFCPQLRLEACILLVWVQFLICKSHRANVPVSQRGQLPR